MARPATRLRRRRETAIAATSETAELVARIEAELLAPPRERNETLVRETLAALEAARRRLTGLLAERTRTALDLGTQFAPGKVPAALPLIGDEFRPQSKSRRKAGLKERLAFRLILGITGPFPIDAGGQGAFFLDPFCQKLDPFVRSDRHDA